MTTTLIEAEADDALDMALAKEAAEVLVAHYPGHMWAVHAKGGVLIVKNMRLSSTHGFILHLQDIQHDAGYRKRMLVRAGGELLERHGHPRAAYVSTSC